MLAKSSGTLITISGMQPGIVVICGRTTEIFDVTQGICTDVMYSGSSPRTNPRLRSHDQDSFLSSPGGHSHGTSSLANEFRIATPHRTPGEGLHRSSSAGADIVWSAFG